MRAVLQGRAGVRVAIVLSAMAAHAFAQSGQQRPAPQPPPARVRPEAYPQRPPADPAIVARGKAIYGVNCNFCHGSDARGGEGGPNLLRSEMVLNDQNGELIAPIVQNGRGEMPKLNLNKDQIADIAAFIHSFRVGGYDISRNPPPSILTGDAKAGEAEFKKRCASCHSPAGDLKGVASKYSEPRILQNTFLLPGGGGRGGRGGGGGGRAVTVTVTLADGKKEEGRLVRIDDFIVTLADADGIHRSFRRDGETPRVEIHNPAQPHRDMIPTYTDEQIHNITAYLVTLK